MSELRAKLKNLTNGRKYMTALLTKYQANDIVKEEDFLTLLQYHPTKKINIDSVEYLTLRVRPPYNTLSLYYKSKDSELDDVSYILCLKKLFGKYSATKSNEDDVRNAFRNDSHMGRQKQFFIQNTKRENDIPFGVCEHCGKKTSKITVDHHEIPFKCILKEFLEKEGTQMVDYEVFENHVHEIRLKKTEVARKWLEFHDTKAKFRMLCKSCNSHFGDYGQ